MGKCEKLLNVDFWGCFWHSRVRSRKVAFWLWFEIFGIVAWWGGEVLRSFLSHIILKVSL